MTGWRGIIETYRARMPVGERTPVALLDGPEWVVTAHRNFINAGAQVITTNSYAVVPFHLGDERFTARGRELAHLAGEWRLHLFHRPSA